MHDSCPTSPIRHHDRSEPSLRRVHARKACIAGLVLVAVLGSGNPSWAYNLILKDGTQLDTLEPYRIEGDRAVFTLNSGTESSIALSEIDVEKTRKANERVLGSAVMIDRDGTAKAWDPESIENRQSPKTLQRLLRERRQQREGAAPEPVESDVDLPSVLRKTVGGRDDLLSLERQPPLQSSLAEGLENELRKQGASGFLIYQGTRADRLFVEWPTQGESDIMDKLPRFARALGPTLSETTLGAVELLFVTGNRERAGQFLFDGDNSALLADKAITPGEFFVAFVEF